MRKSKARRRILWWSGVGGVLFISLAYWTFGSGPSKKAVLETAAVEFGDLAVELPATGSIDAVNVIDVGAVVSGRIKAIYTDFNDRVKAGQLLAEIEDQDYRATWMQTVADLGAAKAAIEVAAAGLQAARSDAVRAAAAVQQAQALAEQKRLDYERRQKLLAEGLATRADFDLAERDYRTTRADVESAAALLRQTQSQVKNSEAGVDEARAMADQRAARAGQAKQNLDYCRIISPVDGVVVSRNMDVGQTVAARLQAPSLFHIAQDLSHMYVYTKMDSSDVAKVRPGLAATFSVNAFPGEVFEGTLTQVRIYANAPAPISRAIGSSSMFQRQMSAGVGGSSISATQTGGSTTSSSSSSSSGSSGSSGSGSGAGGSSGGSGSGGGGGGSSSSSSSGTSATGASTATTTTAGAAPPDATLNTVVVYDALIEFRNPELKLLPGMTAYVTIPIASIKDTLKVPSAALRFSPDISAEEKQSLLESAGLRPDDSIVWVVLGQKRYRPVRVKTLLTDYVYTAVQSDGLKPGMKVATLLIEPSPTS